MGPFISANPDMGGFGSITQGQGSGTSPRVDGDGSFASFLEWNPRGDLVSPWEKSPSDALKPWPDATGGSTTRPTDLVVSSEFYSAESPADFGFDDGLPAKLKLRLPDEASAGSVHPMVAAQGSAVSIITTPGPLANFVPSAPVVSAPAALVDGSSFTEPAVEGLHDAVVRPKSVPTPGVPETPLSSGTPVQPGGSLPAGPAGSRTGPSPSPENIPAAPRVTAERAADLPVRTFQGPGTSPLPSPAADVAREPISLFSRGGAGSARAEGHNPGVRTSPASGSARIVETEVSNSAAAGRVSRAGTGSVPGGSAIENPSAAASAAATKGIAAANAPSNPIPLIVRTDGTISDDPIEDGSVPARPSPFRSGGRVSSTTAPAASSQVEVTPRQDGLIAKASTPTDALTHAPVRTVGSAPVSGSERYSGVRQLAGASELATTSVPLSTQNGVPSGASPSTPRPATGVLPTPPAPTEAVQGSTTGFSLSAHDGSPSMGEGRSAINQSPKPTLPASRHGVTEPGTSKNPVPTQPGQALEGVSPGGSGPRGPLQESGLGTEVRPTDAKVNRISAGSDPSSKNIRPTTETGKSVNSAPDTLDRASSPSNGKDVATAPTNRQVTKLSTAPRVRINPSPTAPPRTPIAPNVESSPGRPVVPESTPRFAPVTPPTSKSSARPAMPAKPDATTLPATPTSPPTPTSLGRSTNLSTPVAPSTATNKYDAATTIQDSHGPSEPSSGSSRRMQDTVRVPSGSTIESAPLSSRVGIPVRSPGSMSPPSHADGSTQSIAQANRSDSPTAPTAAVQLRTTTASSSLSTADTPISSVGSGAPVAASKTTAASAPVAPIRTAAPSAPVTSSEPVVAKTPNTPSEPVVAKTPNAPSVPVAASAPSVNATAAAGSIEPFTSFPTQTPTRSEAGPARADITSVATGTEDLTLDVGTKSPGAASIASEREMRVSAISQSPRDTLVSAIPEGRMNVEAPQSVLSPTPKSATLEGAEVDHRSEASSELIGRTQRSAPSLAAATDGTSKVPTTPAAAVDVAASSLTGAPADTEAFSVTPNTATSSGDPVRPLGENRSEVQKAWSAPPLESFASLESLSRDLMSTVRMTLQSSARSAVVRLNPRELGAVRIEIEVDGDLIRGRLQAERPSVRALLVQQMGDLERGLERQGFVVDQLKVDESSVDSDSSNSTWNSSHENSPGERGMTRRPPWNRANASESARLARNLVPAERPSLSTTGHIDLHA